MGSIEAVKSIECKSLDSDSTYKISTEYMPAWTVASSGSSYAWGVDSTSLAFPPVDEEVDALKSQIRELQAEVYKLTHELECQKTKINKLLVSLIELGDDLLAKGV